MGKDHLYFFAVRTDGGFEIDSIGRYLDDSAGYERIDVEHGGLVAWDEEGRLYQFEPSRDRENAGWRFRVGSQNAEELRAALLRFLNMVGTSRRHRRRARSAGVDLGRLEGASIDVLVETVRRINLVDEY